MPTGYCVLNTEAPLLKGGVHDIIPNAPAQYATKNHMKTGLCDSELCQWTMDCVMCVNCVNL